MSAPPVRYTRRRTLVGMSIPTPGRILHVHPTTAGSSLTGCVPAMVTYCDPGDSVVHVAAFVPGAVVVTPLVLPRESGGWHWPQACPTTREQNAQ